MINESKIQNKTSFEMSPLDAANVVISSIICFTSIIGNIIVVIIISRNKHMQTITYKLILNLAVTDLFSSLICIPLEIPMFLNGGRWIYGAVFCKILYPLQTLSVYATAFTLVTVSAVRCWSVALPSKCPSKSFKVRWFILPIWMLSFAAVVPYILVLYHTDDQMECSEKWNELQSKRYTVFIFLTQFVIPLTIISIAYAIFVIRLEQNLKRVASSLRVKRKKEVEKVTRMVTAATINFAVCVLPYHVLWIWKQFGTIRSEVPFEELKVVMYLLLFSHSAVNPVLYNLFNETFRNSLKDLCKLHGNKNTECDFPVAYV